MVVLSMQFRSTAWSRPAWMRFQGGTVEDESEDDGGERENARLLIGESREVAEEYRDEGEDAEGVLRETDVEGGRGPRLEPSGLTGDGEQWRE